MGILSILKHLYLNDYESSIVKFHIIFYDDYLLTFEIS